jgi:hypothetical protein
MSFYVVNASMNIRVLLDLSALSVNQTRLIATSVLEAKTLAARLLVQSLKLTRSKANRRYQSRLSQITSMIRAKCLMYSVSPDRGRQDKHQGF